MFKRIFFGLLLGFSFLIARAVPGSAQDRLAAEGSTLAIRHQLVTLPYYNVFDWLDGEVRPDGSVVLRGEVIEPSTRLDAAARVRKIEGVTSVINEIRVLPPGSTDNVYRIALYRAIFRYSSPLFRYSTQAVPPIHIVVDNGRATLKGVVSSASESQLAYTAARQISGLFDVQNELQVVTE
jgi:hyperosmotically inducible periplasmic protein